jgi:catechol 2,3-dioxygenase-like lactoylglutathione lyase family enzyme
VPRIQHVTVTVPSEEGIAAAQAFYEMLGGIPLVRPPALAADTPGCWLGFGDTQLHVIVGEADPGPAHLAMDVGDEYDSILSRLTEADVPRRDARKLWGARRCFVRDPAGNLVELFERPPESVPETAG